MEVASFVLWECGGYQNVKRFLQKHLNSFDVTDFPTSFPDVKKSSKGNDKSYIWTGISLLPFIQKQPLENLLKKMCLKSSQNAQEKPFFQVSF